MSRHAWPIVRRDEILLALLLAVGLALSLSLGGGFAWGALAASFHALAPGLAGFFLLSRLLAARDPLSDWLARDLEWLRGLAWYLAALALWGNLAVRLPLLRSPSYHAFQTDLDAVVGLGSLAAWAERFESWAAFLGGWQMWALALFFGLWLLLWRTTDRQALRWAWTSASLCLVLGALVGVAYPVLDPFVVSFDAFSWLREPVQTSAGLRQSIQFQSFLETVRALNRELSLPGRAVWNYTQHFVLPASQMAVLSVVAWRRHRVLGGVGAAVTLLTWLAAASLGWSHAVHGLVAVVAAAVVTLGVEKGQRLLECPDEVVDAVDAAEIDVVTVAEADDKPTDEAWWRDGPRRRRALLRILVYPWFFFFLVGRVAAPVKRSRAWRWSRSLRWTTRGMEVLLIVLVALPATVLVTGELLITANEMVIAEQADYRLQSDFEVGYADARLEVPGPRTPGLDPVPPDAGEAYYTYLTELYAPVFLQKMSHRPAWDVPLLMDYDGNLDPRDNVDNAEGLVAFRAGVYGEVTGITEDSIYLTYSLYHIKDYDHPIRERISRWTYHDNDNEGLHIRVDRSTGQVAEVETWFHNRFLLFNHTGVSTGTEPVHGRIHTEDETHIIVYAQPQGHGVRCAQVVDGDSLRQNVKVLRFRGDRPVKPVLPDHTVQVDGTYELGNFDSWYEQALGPFGSQGRGTSIFEQTINLGPDLPAIGRFIAGRDYDVNSWSRPKPMWSWDDGWDSIPILVWHFFPDASFRSHGGSELSADYVYNRPSERVFGLPADEVRSRLRLRLEMRGGEKWEDLQGRGGELEHRVYWQALIHSLKGYVNYLFHALG